MPSKPAKSVKKGKRTGGRAEQTRRTGAKYKRISVKKILLSGNEELDEKIVEDIAESIQVSDLFHPIAVRRVRETLENGETSEKVVLVSGAHRLEAMKRLGRTKILAFYVEGDDLDAQLVRLGEDLWRKTLTVLQHAEKLVEYLSVASGKLDISGQSGQKSQIGRPPSGIALAARKLPQLGRSIEARRKIIGRATKISQITPEAKKAAIDADLEDNQDALLEIAKASGHKAQLRKVADLAERAKILSRPLNAKSDGKTAENDLSAKPSTEDQSSPDQASESEDGVDVAIETEADASPLVHKTTSFDEMSALWKREQRDGWAFLPSRERERFIEKLRRARRRAPSDIVNFIKEIFQGRPAIKSRQLFGFAIAHGFGRSTIRKALNALGYPSDPLSQRPLVWLMDKAGAVGLAYRDSVEIDATEVAPPINDSYREFGKGFYHFFSKPFYRPVGLAPEKGSEATTSRINETIDGSVFDRWRTDASYRPKNLMNWAQAKQVDPAKLVGAVMATDPKIGAP
jgi:ParB-like chromosome segregation protein Spo0J